MDATLFAILCFGKYLIKSIVKILVEIWTKLNSMIVCLLVEYFEKYIYLATSDKPAMLELVVFVWFHLLWQFFIGSVWVTFTGTSVTTMRVFRDIFVID